MYLEHANQCGTVLYTRRNGAHTLTVLFKCYAVMMPDLTQQHLIFGFLIFWECPSDLISAASIAPGRCLERVLIP